MTLQQVLRDWVVSRLGQDAMEPLERARRFLEEAMEVAQAVGVTHTELLKIARIVYDKPPGEIRQELGGADTTLATLAESLSLDIERCTLYEYDRICRLPLELFRRRQEQNRKDGIGS